MNKKWLTGLVAVVLACGSDPDESAADLEPPDFEPPVVTNPSTPVEYPLSLYEQGVEGVVVLRLFVDETGTVVPESTRVAEPSGQPELDSAAVRGVDQMSFAPARRRGVAVATEFLQPIHFRKPDGVARNDSQ